MDGLLHKLPLLAGFVIVALAAGRIGGFGSRLKLPLITGFLLTGVLAGPSCLGLIQDSAVRELEFINDFALALIAFAAGNELFLKGLRGRGRAISRITTAQLFSTWLIGAGAVWLLADQISFMREMGAGARFGVSALAGSILVARSPSSAIAIVRELRAKGPFTQMVMGVTVITDVLVIVVFAFSSDLAQAFLSDLSFDIGFLVLLGLELGLSFLAGCLVWKALCLLLGMPLSLGSKTLVVLLCGFGVFLGCEEARHVSKGVLGFEILLEPLLVCMIAGLLVTNRSPHRREFSRLLHQAGPPVYLVFFTLTGASLSLEVLAASWEIAAVIFLVRLLGIFVGSFAGGTLAGESVSRNATSWMAFVTQAGVGIGLAREVAHEFPAFGPEFATVMIAVIIINQLVGPPLFKWVIIKEGEAHLKAPSPGFDGVRDAIIFGGGGGRSPVLARQLQARGWEVKLAVVAREGDDALTASDVENVFLDELSVASLERLQTRKAEAIVAMMSDEDNRRLCELVYEHFGVENVIVLVRDRSEAGFFLELGAKPVDPSTAIINLIEHFVVSPAATSLILGLEEGQEAIEIEVRDPSFEGVPLRNLDLPEDTLVLSVVRDGHTILAHGDTTLRVGDHVTVVGAKDNLDATRLLLEE